MVWSWDVFCIGVGVGFGLALAGVLVVMMRISAAWDR